MSQHVIDEAKRCLKCKVPMCSKGCPVGTPIPKVIDLFLNGDIAKAGELLFFNNPLTSVCCHVCPQEDQCEGNCILNKKGMPIKFSDIEQYISQYFLSTFVPTPSKKTRGRIAVIGSGPAGITIAFILSSRDYDVTIFEGHDKIGGVLRYGIPEFRLPKEVLDKLKDLLIKSGVRIRPNTSIGTNLTIDDLMRDEYKAVFMGTGVWRPNKMSIKGETLGHVHYSIEYLRNPDVYDLGRKVAIIGAGNVAMDVARTVIRHGSREVYIVCTKGEDSIAARKIESEYAKLEGTKFMFNKLAKEFVDDGVVLYDTIVSVDENGKKIATPIEGSEKFEQFDSIIIAIGQGPRAVIVSSTTGIEVDKKGLVSVNADGSTSRAGVFASGDVVTGAKTVVEAVRLSRKVADAMDEYVSSLK